MRKVSMVDFKLFSGSSNFPLAQKAAEGLGMPVSQSEIFKFSNNETRVRIIDDVRGKVCFVLQSMGTPVDENWAETLFFIDALKRSGAGEIICAIPFLGYQKQDKQFRTGEAVSVAAVAKTLEALGMDELLTFDLHNPEIVNYFTKPVTALSAFPLFSEEIKRLLRFARNDNGTNDDFVLLAPDDGAYWAKDFADKLEIMVAVADKKRDRETSLLSKELPIKGDLRNKKVILIDDNVYTGSTLILNAQNAKGLGAVSVDCFVTHAILSGNASSDLQNSEIDSLTVSDTIFVPGEKQFPKLKIISIVHILVEEIKRIV